MPGTPVPRAYANSLWQKLTFQQKYNNFENKFSKIDKKFVSQSILEVGHFTHFSVSVKKLPIISIIIKIHQIYYRISYAKCQGFEKTPLFFQRWSAQLLESIVWRFFYRFWKTFFQSDCIFLENRLGAVSMPSSERVPIGTNRSAETLYFS